MALFIIALSREDGAEVEAFENILRQIRPELRDAAVFPMVSYYRDGDFSGFKVSGRGTDVAGAMMMCFTEHEHDPPEDLLKQGDYFADDMTLRATAIARALSAGGNAALAQAIDEAEAHHLIVHAARMRIILARRTGDRRYLEQARAVLEPLEDRLFLSRLREVEALLAAE
jgi:hypothetical protein